MLSRYAAVQVPGVEARWHKASARALTTLPYAKKVNYLLLPWPLRIRASDFRPVAGPLQRLANDPFGFFEFIPSERLDLDLADRTLAAARDRLALSTSSSCRKARWNTARSTTWKLSWPGTK